MIRLAGKKDASRLAEILIFAKRTAYRRIFQDDNVSFNEMRVLDLALEYQDSPGALNDVYVYDDGIVKGMMSWGCGNPSQWELRELYVDPFFQGQGIGRKLIQHFIESAGIHGVGQVFLWVLEKNGHAREIYKSFGFQPNGEKMLQPGTKEFLLRYVKSLAGQGGYHIIGMESYQRKSHFDYFNSLAYPYIGTTSQIEITGFLKIVKERGLPFFLTFCYCAANAVNHIREFRQRIFHNRIIEFDSCKTSHTVALDDGTYCYCTLDSNKPFREYLPYAVGMQEQAKKQKSIEEKQEDILDKILISTLPWFSYTSLVQPVPMPADSNPRITWGKYYHQLDRVYLPVSVLCHHALVDGLHIAGFFQALEEQMKAISG